MALSQPHKSISGFSPPPRTEALERERRKTLLKCVELEKQVDRFKAAQGIASRQAKDECLWFKAQSEPEGYLQHELKRLHAAIESCDGLQ